MGNSSSIRLHSEVENKQLKASGVTGAGTSQLMILPTLVIIFLGPISVSTFVGSVVVNIEHVGE